MKILLTGADGFIGYAILTELLKRGHRVTACSRHPERLLIEHEALSRLAVDFNQAVRAEDWLPRFGDIDAVINCVGIIAENRRQHFELLHHRTPAALFAAAARAGVKKVVQISALGADDDARSRYHVSKKAADDALRQLPLDWFVLQPSLVYGTRGQSAALFDGLAAMPVHVLPGGGRQKIQPIHVDDVVAAVTRCLDADITGRQTLALVGPESIAYADWLQGLRKRLGKPPALPLSISMQYAKIVAGFGKWLQEPILNADNIAMLARNNCADAKDLCIFLERPPGNVTTRLFEQPASRAERWHADLYFFRPGAGLIIAWVWLWSGITSLWFYPHELSYRLLAETGIHGWGAPLTLYGLALMDIAFGALTLYRYRLKLLLLWQLLIVFGYSAIVAWRLPEFVFHPFGPLLKNLPFLMLLLIYRVLEGEKA